MMFFYYRITSETLSTSSQSLLRRLRANRALDSAPFLVTDQATIWGEKHSQLNKRSIARSLAPKPSDTCDSDVECMDKFICSSNISDTIIPVIAGKKQTLPDGIPIIDVLRAHLSAHDAWKYPSQDILNIWTGRRGYAYELLDVVECEEIIIGKTSEADVIKIAQWAIEKYENSEDICPAGVLPFNAEHVPISSFDIVRMGRTENFGKPFILESSTNPPKIDEEEWFTDSTGKLKQNKWTKLPAKIYMGDGVNWMLAISFNITIDGHRVKVTPGPLHSALVQFLHHLPPLVGFNIKLDVLSVESTFRKMYGFRISLPHFIHISSLAVLAGWKMSTTTPEALTMVCLGTPVNHIVTGGDGSWVQPWDQLPRPLKVYMIGEVKNSYLVYNTLALCLRQEILTEPDAWCFLVKRIQRITLAWWTEWLARLLRGLFVDKAALKEATSRPQAVGALRAIDPEGRILDHPPYRVRLIASLLTNTITVMRGAARFLHVERERAMTNFRVMKTMVVTSVVEHLEETEISESDVLYIRFGQTNIQALDQRLPVVRGNDDIILTFHPSLPLQQVHIATGSLTIQYLLDRFRSFARPQQEGLLEWARLNLKRIEAFFEACIRNPLLSKKCRAVYELMRMISVRVSNRLPIEIPECEASIARHQQSALREANNVILRIEEDIRALEARREAAIQDLARLQDLVDRGNARERTEGKGPAQPPPRAPEAQPDQRPRIGDGPVNDIEANRRGASPARRAREQPALPEVVLPPRGEGNEHQDTPWVDHDEDPENGRAWCNQKKNSAVTETRTIRLLP